MTEFIQLSPGMRDATPEETMKYEMDLVDNYEYYEDEYAEYGTLDLPAVQYFPCTKFVEVLKEFFKDYNMIIEHSIRGYIEHDGGFFMHHGGGYDWVDMDLLGGYGNGARKQAFAEWLNEQNYILNSLVD